MMRRKVFDLFQRHRAYWLDSADGRAAVADVRRLLVDEGRPSAAKVLSDDGVWRVALQGLAADASLPLHDHPGTRGLLSVVQGRLRVRRFDVARRVAGARTLVLVHRGERVLDPGDCDWFGASWHNLHALKSVSAFTLVFSIRQSRGVPLQRSLFAFLREPADGETTGVALVVPARPRAPGSVRRGI